VCVIVNRFERTVEADVCVPGTDPARLDAMSIRANTGAFHRLLQRNRGPDGASFFAE
jgi:hypothetical protein